MSETQEPHTKKKIYKNKQYLKHKYLNPKLKIQHEINEQYTIIQSTSKLMIQKGRSNIQKLQN